MLEKIYVALWGVYFAVVGLVSLTGNMNTSTGIVLGFIFFGMTFMGMIGVLPHWATHNDGLPH